MSYELDEIVVFESCYRREVFISQIQQVHIDHPHLITIYKATLEQKKQWY